MIYYKNRGKLDEASQLSHEFNKLTHYVAVSNLKKMCKSVYLIEKT